MSSVSCVIPWLKCQQLADQDHLTPWWADAAIPCPSTGCCKYGLVESPTQQSMELRSRLMSGHRVRKIKCWCHLLQQKNGLPGLMWQSSIMLENDVFRILDSNFTKYWKGGGSFCQRYRAFPWETVSERIFKIHISYEKKSKSRFWLERGSQVWVEEQSNTYTDTLV